MALLQSKTRRSHLLFTNGTQHGGRGKFEEITPDSHRAEGGKERIEAIGTRHQGCLHRLYAGGGCLGERGLRHELMNRICLKRSAHVVPSIFPFQVRLMLESKTADFFRVLIGRYKAEMEKRKLLHNQLIELNGNIRVFYRIRPQLGKITELPALEVDSMDTGKQMTRN